MKILEKHNYEFKAQSDKLIGWNVFKCNLFDEPFNKYDLFFELSDRHKKEILNSTSDDLIIGEYGKLRDYGPDEKYNDDELKLSMVFNRDGIFFESHYVINISNGLVSFKMDKPIIVVKDFIATDDMDEALVDLIKEKITTDKWTIAVENEKFYKYCSGKFIEQFIDYVKYLEELVLADKCKDCAGKYKYTLSGFCKDLYIKNGCKK